MTNEEILKLAIEKAVRNGWLGGGEIGTLLVGEYDYDDRAVYIEIQSSDRGTTYRSFYDLIFSHDFAKAFWGEAEVCESDGVLINDRGCHCAIYQEWGRCFTELAWQYHLQQMVLEEDPISYLEQFL